jgi:hypothetical protein
MKKMLGFFQQKLGFTMISPCFHHVSLASIDGSIGFTGIWDVSITQKRGDFIVEDVSTGGRRCMLEQRFSSCRMVGKRPKNTVAACEGLGASHEDFFWETHPNLMVCHHYLYSITINCYSTTINWG